MDAISPNDAAMHIENKKESTLLCISARVHFLTGLGILLVIKEAW